MRICNFDLIMAILKFDIEEYGGVVEDSDGNLFAFSHKTHPEFLTAKNNVVFSCHPFINGELDTTTVTEFKKDELSAKFIRTK